MYKVLGFKNYSTFSVQKLSIDNQAVPKVIPSRVMYVYFDITPSKYFVFSRWFRSKCRGYLEIGEFTIMN